jgi:glucokinase
VGTDFKAAGLAEHRRGALSGANSGLFLSLGTGVAAATRIHGRVVLRAHAAAGEIAYSLRGVHDETSYADGRAPLEEIVGGRFIGLRASRLVGRDLSTADAFAASDLGTRQLVDDALDDLAVHVANIALLIDPDRIAVGGGLMRSADRVMRA